MALVMCVLMIFVKFGLKVLTFISIVPRPPEKVNSDDFLDALLKSISGESGQVCKLGNLNTLL